MLKDLSRGLKNSFFCNLDILTRFVVPMFWPKEPYGKSNPRFFSIGPVRFPLQANTLKWDLFFQFLMPIVISLLIVASLLFLSFIFIALPFAFLVDAFNFFCDLAKRRQGHEVKSGDEEDVAWSVVCLLLLADLSLFTIAMLISGIASVLAVPFSPIKICSRIVATKFYKGKDYDHENIKAATCPELKTAMDIADLSDVFFASQLVECVFARKLLSRADEDYSLLPQFLD